MEKRKIVSRLAAMLTALVMTYTTMAGAESVQTETDLQPPQVTEQQPTTAPTEEPAPTIAPEETPAPVPTEEPVQPPTEAPTEAPSEAPTEAPEATPWVPAGQAWARTDSGAQQDGKLEDVLAWLQQGQEKAMVYLLTTEKLTVRDVSRSLLERLTFLPDDGAFEARKYEVALNVIGDAQAERVDVQVQVIRKSSATPAPTETPNLRITVKVDDYRPGQWSNVAPWFAMAGIPEGDREHVYGVFVCDRQLTLLSDGSNAYVPREEGEISVRLAIMDMMGDVVSLSQQYDMLLDMTPPTTPYLMLDEGSETSCTLEVSDEMSGLAAYSLDGGATWTALSGETATITITGNKDDVIEAGMVQVRDAAGNIAVNEERFTFRRISMGGGGGWSGTKPIKHVKETMDYSTANYNALELIFAEEAQTELVAGDTVLNLSLYEGSGTEPQPFTASMTTWQKVADETPDHPNVLLLRSEIAEESSTWRFSGDVYRLLYNSGVDFIILAAGDYITVLPTEGFTAGTQYGKLKAAGVSTKKFDYAISQDPLLLETVVSVQVEGETYLLEEDEGSVMYRCGVLIGDTTMLDQPYESYLPEEE